MKEIKAKIGINLSAVKCPECLELQPLFRKPNDLYEFLWGGYTCKKCGCKMDKYGKKRD